MTFIDELNSIGKLAAKENAALRKAQRDAPRPDMRITFADLRAKLDYLQNAWGAGDDVIVIYDQPFADLLEQLISETKEI